MNAKNYKKINNYYGILLTNNKVYFPKSSQTCTPQLYPNLCMNDYHTMPPPQSEIMSGNDNGHTFLEDDGGSDIFKKSGGGNHYPYIVPIREEMKSYESGQNCDFTKCIVPSNPTTTPNCESCNGGGSGIISKEKFSKSKCEAGQCDNSNEKLDNILDPKFNIKEASKNCLLLEDHLFHQKRRCKDCIIKHCALIEAFLEEAITLDKNNKYTNLINKNLKDFKNVQIEIKQCIEKNKLNNNECCCNLAQKLRTIRKDLLLSSY